MTLQERIHTLESVVRTFDNNLVISGLRNMETVVGCIGAINVVLKDMRLEADQIESEVKT